MSDKEEALPVEQADRDAAAAIIPFLCAPTFVSEVAHMLARHRRASTAALEAENARLQDLLFASTEWMESVLAAMDKYNKANGTYIIGPSLPGCGQQIARNRAALGKQEQSDG